MIFFCLQVTAATSMGSVRSAGLSLILLSFFLYIADSYPNTELSNSKFLSQYLPLMSYHVFVNPEIINHM